MEREFVASRAVLASKRTEIKGKGKGNLPNASGPISSEECASPPETIFNTLWLNNTTLFGIRGCSENHNLCLGI